MFGQRAFGTSPFGEVRQPVDIYFPGAAGEVEVGRINLRDPINWKHPLNQFRLAWYLAIPDQAGGPVFFDLCYGRHATLTSFSSGEMWKGTSRPGGYGELSLAGTGYGTSLIPQTAVAMAAWVKTASTGTVGICGIGNTGDIRNATDWDREVYLSDGQVNWYTSPSGSVGGVGPGLNDGKWHRILCTIGVTDLTNRVYADGVMIGSSGSGGIYNTGYPNGVANFGVGNCKNGTMVGAIDDVTAYGYWPPDIDSHTLAQMDYELGRRGYPGVLNRALYMEASVAILAGGGVFDFALGAIENGGLAYYAF